MFLVSQLTAELWNACMSITFSGMGYEMVNQIIVVEKGHHANIVQVVKTCYKIKINYRESKSCFYGVLLCKQHPSLTIAPLLHYNSDLIQICFTRF